MGLRAMEGQAQHVVLILGVAALPTLGWGLPG
jgi:hypothetical protein